LFVLPIQPAEYNTEELVELSETQRLKRLKQVMENCNGIDKIETPARIIKLLFDGWRNNEKTEITFVP
jgi:hypothetical protein